MDRGSPRLGLDLVEFGDMTNAQLKGYVHISIFMTTHRGDILETTAEAYVVPRMTVPILLGEDYQQAYELTVSRHLEKGTTVQFGGTLHIISASSVEQSSDFDCLCPSAYLVASLVKAKLHCINKCKKTRKKKKNCGGKTYYKSCLRHPYSSRPYE